MPRIRSLKPEIASDAKLASVSIAARYTFVLMITQADDAGLLPGAHRQILGTLYPLNDGVTIPALLGWIEELVGIGLVRWRATRDRIPVIQLVNWSKHQRIDNAGRSQLGALLAASPVDPPLESKSRDDSPHSAATRGDSPLGPPITDQGSPTKDQGSGTTDLARAARLLSAGANRGLADHPDRPQPVPRIIATNGTTHTATKKILGAGVPLEFAVDALIELGKSHGAERPISSLNYFADAVIRAWNEHQAADDTAAVKANEKRARRGERRATPDYAGAATESEDKIKWQR